MSDMRLEAQRKLTGLNGTSQKGITIYDLRLKLLSKDMC